MEILFANLIVYLTRYAFIIRHFFRNYYIKKSLGILKWACIAYAFTLVNGFYGTICYLFLMIYELLTMLNLNKNILVNAILFSLSLI